MMTAAGGGIPPPCYFFPVRTWLHFKFGKYQGFELCRYPYLPTTWGTLESAIYLQKIYALKFADISNKVGIINNH